jgi:hypothetical protein
MQNKKSGLVFFHAKPEFVLRGYDFDVHAAVFSGNVKNSVELIWSAGEIGGSLIMTESGTGAHHGEYTLFSAVIPASALAGNEIKYSFVCNGDKFNSEEFTAEIADAVKLPPITVTEFFGSYNHPMVA